MAHDRARRYAARNRLEPGTRERRSCASENVGSTFRSHRINRICFKRWRIRALCRFHCCFDQSRHDTQSAIAAPHVKARDGPDRHIVHALQSSRAIEPRQIIPRRKLAPADGPLTIEGEQAWRRAMLHDLVECALVFLALPRLWYSLPIRQYMHQQPLLAPPLPNRSSRADQRSGVRGRIVSCMSSYFPLARYSTCGVPPNETKISRRQPAAVRKLGRDLLSFHPS
jgi:hypothetical protein